MRYEVIREIFNSCSGNQMRDVFVTVQDIDNPEAYVKDMLKGNIDLFEIDRSKGCTIIDVVVDGLRQRFSFSED